MDDFGSNCSGRVDVVKLCTRVVFDVLIKTGYGPTSDARADDCYSKMAAHLLTLYGQENVFFIRSARNHPVQYSLML